MSKPVDVRDLVMLKDLCGKPAVGPYGESLQRESRRLVPGIIDELMELRAANRQLKHALAKNARQVTEETGKSNAAR